MCHLGWGLQHALALSTSKVCCCRACAGASGSKANLTSADYSLLELLLSWPAPQLFPAYDIARLVALDPEGAQHLASSAGLLSPGTSGQLGAALYRGTEEPQLVPSQQTGLRLACNLCKHLPLRQWLQAHSAALMDRFAPCCSSTNKGVRFAFATFMLNLAVFYSTAAKADAEGQAQALSALSELLTGTPYYEADTLYRAFNAVGTLSMANSESKQLAQDLGILQTGRDILRQPLEPKLLAVIQDLVTLLKP